MIPRLIHWAVDSRLVTVLLAVALLAFGIYSFWQVNVEAYPDPAPPIVEVIAQYPGASAEEVERQVTIPLEVLLAGMPGLQYTRSESLFELSHIRNQFHYGVDPLAARQEVINRLQFTQLPPGVTPQISPESPTGEIFRYTIAKSQGRRGQADLQPQRPEIAAGLDAGAACSAACRGSSTWRASAAPTKRYEIHPDPARLRRYGITLQQLKDAVSGSQRQHRRPVRHARRGGQVVRGLGLIGRGQDPMDQALCRLQDPAAARDMSPRRGRAADSAKSAKSCWPRSTTCPSGSTTWSKADRSAPSQPVGEQGVVVGHQTRLGRVMLSQPKKDAHGNDVYDEHGHRQWDDDDDAVQAIVLLRKGEESLPALQDVDALIKELNRRRRPHAARREDRRALRPPIA